MVRKRSRKYESEDNDSDSDIDFGAEEVSEPAPKKYSLRERKSTSLLTADYDYYGLDDDDDAQKQSSDDEDFEVEAEAEGAAPDHDGYETGEIDPDNPDGLIDFEDIIRADIVVNKNKIDYDNLIQKTEIKLSQPKRRGRKPKNYDETSDVETEIKAEESEAGDVFEPQVQALSKLERQDGDPPDVPADILQPEINFCEEAPADGLNSSDGAADKSDEIDPLAMFNNSNKNAGVAPKPSAVVPEPPAPEPPVVVNPEAASKAVASRSATAVVDAVKDEGDDDDVIVLGELEQDVIVLDD